MVSKATAKSTADNGKDDDQSGDKPSSGDTAGAAKSKDDGGRDAIALIKDDHRHVEQLFDKVEKAASGNQKQLLVRQICLELATHTLIEERIPYPACRGKIDDAQLDVAQVEHDGAKELIVELQWARVSDPYYDAKVKVLSEYIKHHVAEEEEPGDGILDAAKTAGVDTAALGKEIEAQRDELRAEAADTEVPEMPSKSRGGTAYHKEDDMAQRYMDNRGGRSRYDDDNGGRGSSGRHRDEYGRFTSDDDDRGGGRGRSGNDRDDDRYSSGGSRGGRDHGQGGWFGDPEGHSEASRRGWEHREGGSRYGRDDDDRRSYSSSRGSSRYRDDDDDRRGGRDHGQGGWFGDPEGHSEASRRGWEHREGSSRHGRDDDDRGYSSQSRGGGSRYRDDDDHRSSRDHGQSGWFGDSEGHSEASRRGWSNR